MRLCLIALCLLPALVRAAGWQMVRDDPERHIQVYVRGEASQPYHAVYALTDLQAPTSAVVAVLEDVPAAPEWIARVSASRVLRQQGDERWVYSNYHLPYPFQPRDAVLHSQLSRDAAGVVTLDTRAVSDMVEPRPGHVRLTDFHSTWKVTPEPGGHVRVELWGEGSPGGYIPSWLFNYSLPDEPVQTLRNLRRMVQRPRYLNPPAASGQPQNKAR